MGVSFDLFGTLVSVDVPDDPATAVARELTVRNVTVPDDWRTAYAEPHVEVPDGGEVPLPIHVWRALESRGVTAAESTTKRAVEAAFDPTVRTRKRALAVVERAAATGPIAICSNCSVPGLVERTLDASALDPVMFDAIVTSVDCGYRKPAPEIFERTADAIGVPVDQLVHVGDDVRTDGGIEALGGTAVVSATDPLAGAAAWLAENERDRS